MLIYGHSLFSLVNLFDEVTDYCIVAFVKEAGYFLSNIPENFVLSQFNFVLSQSFDD